MALHFSPKCSGNSNNDMIKNSTVVSSTVVAVKKDKKSVYAVRWAIDHLTTTNPSLTMIYVKRKRNIVDEATSEVSEDSHDVFDPFYGYGARKGVKLNEVVIEENDISKAILEYVAKNYITNVVIGSSPRNTLSMKLKHNYVSDSLIKSAPNFCNVFVISKGKVIDVRRAVRTALNTPTPPKSQPLTNSLDHSNSNGTRYNEKLTRKGRLRGGSDALGLQSLSDNNPNSPELVNIAKHRLLRSPSYDSMSDRLSGEYSPAQIGFGSLDITDHTYDFSVVMAPCTDDTPISHSPKDLEAEMKRLKLELKQTMKMYNNACKEALTAKKKVTIYLD